MTVKVERGIDCSQARDEELRKGVEKGIKNQIFVSCDCEVVCHGELPRSERKTKRVFDKRD